MNATVHSALRIWFGPGLVWLALMALLAATVGSAYVPLGIFNSIINMLIAAIKVSLVLLFFMQVKSSSATIRLVSGAGLFWLVLMFSLTASDYLTRQ
jgi:cytochrome c oxidase subunit 4